MKKKKEEVVKNNHRSQNTYASLRGSYELTGVTQGQGGEHEVRGKGVLYELTGCK